MHATNTTALFFTLPRKHRYNPPQNPVFTQISPFSPLRPLRTCQTPPTSPTLSPPSTPSASKNLPPLPPLLITTHFLCVFCVLCGSNPLRAPRASARNPAVLFSAQSAPKNHLKSAPPCSKICINLRNLRTKIPIPRTKSPNSLKLSILPTNFAKQPPNHPFPHQKHPKPLKNSLKPTKSTPFRTKPASRRHGLMASPALPQKPFQSPPRSPRLCENKLFSDDKGITTPKTSPLSSPPRPLRQKICPCPKICVNLRHLRTKRPTPTPPPPKPKHPPKSAINKTKPCPFNPQPTSSAARDTSLRRPGRASPWRAGFRRFAARVESGIITTRPFSI